MDDQQNQNEARDGRSDSTAVLERRTFLAWWAKNHRKFPELSKESFEAIEAGFCEMAQDERNGIAQEARELGGAITVGAILLRSNVKLTEQANAELEKEL